MRVKLITAIVLILCGVGIGWFAYENLMWAVWGKQNRWFEYVGFWGCVLIFISGVVALKSLRLGTVLGCVGFFLMLFYLGPALVNTFQEIFAGNLTLKPLEITLLLLIIGIPVVTMLRLIWNVNNLYSAGRRE